MSHHDDEVNEVDLLKWPDPLPEAWAAESVAAPAGWEQAYRITEAGEDRGTVLVTHVTRTELRLSYPAGVRDRLLQPSADAPAAALQLASEKVWELDPECRRLVLATDEGDVPQISRGEEAGYRYVVDVDLRDRAVSLMAAEPDWVIEESRHLDDVPVH